MHEWARYNPLMDLVSQAWDVLGECEEQAPRLTKSRGPNGLPTTIATLTPYIAAKVIFR